MLLSFERPARRRLLEDLVPGYRVASFASSRTLKTAQ